MARIRCPKCAKQVTIDDPKAGALVACPECGQKLRLPKAQPASADKTARKSSTRSAMRDEEPEDDTDAEQEYDEDERPASGKKKKRKKKNAEPSTQFWLIWGGAFLSAVVLTIVLLNVFNWDPNPKKEHSPLGIIGWGCVMLVIACFMAVAGGFGIKNKEFSWVDVNYGILDLFFKRKREWSLTGGSAVAMGVMFSLFGATFTGFALCTLTFSPPKPQQGPAPIAMMPVPGAPSKPAENADPLTQALADLKSGDFFRRKTALESLGRMKPNDRRPEVVQALDETSNDTNPFLRMAALQALVAWNGKDSVPTLLKALNGQDVQLRKVAIEALGELKDERAITPLAQRLSDFFDRPHASKVLLTFGPGAEKAVAKQLDHQQPEVKVEACKILQVIGTKDSVPDLQALAKAKDFFASPAAEEALKAIAARP